MMPPHDCEQYTATGHRQQSSLLSRERPFAQTNPATTPTADGVDLLENYTNINRQLRDYFP
jgi:hypothetical protein